MKMTTEFTIEKIKNFLEKLDAFTKNAKTKIHATIYVMNTSIEKIQ